MKFFAASLVCLVLGVANANPHQQYKTMQQVHQASERQGFGVNADLNVGVPSLPQDNNILTTAIIGVGVLAFLNLVVTVAEPFFKKKPTATNSTAPATNSTKASGRSAKYNLLDLTDEVLGAIEALGKEFEPSN